MGRQHVEAGRIGALVTQHRYGRELYRRMGAASTSSAAYGDSEAARRQRMRDVRAKREYVKQYGESEGLRRWTALVERHRKQFAPLGQKGDS